MLNLFGLGKPQKNLYSVVRLLRPFSSENSSKRILTIFLLHKFWTKRAMFLGQILWVCRPTTQYTIGYVVLNKIYLIFKRLQINKKKTLNFFLFLCGFPEYSFGIKIFHAIFVCRGWTFDILPFTHLLATAGTKSKFTWARADQSAKRVRNYLWSNTDQKLHNLYVN